MVGKSDTIAVILRVVMVGGCWWWWECNGMWGNDEFQRYVQRSDRMTTSSGDAKEVNAMAHIPTPWPRGVSDRRLFSDSAHMQNALDRYRRGARPPDSMPDVSPPDGAMGASLSPEKGGNGGTGGGGGGVAPAPYQAQ